MESLRSKIIILAVVAAIFLLAFVYFGFWPVAIVDGSAITAREFNRNYDVGIKIYKNELEIYGEDEKKIKNDEVQKEIKRAVLEKIIENKMVLENLQKLMGEGDIEKKINEKLSAQDLGRDGVKKGIEIAYGLNVDEFKEVVLIPQAKKEILEGNMFIADPLNDFDKWYKEKSGQMEVMIFLPGLVWENGAVKINSGK